MEFDALISYLFTVTIMGVGLVVCVCSGLIAACWFMDRARERLMLSRTRWLDARAVERAIDEWKTRNPGEVERLARLRAQADWS